MQMLTVGRHLFQRDGPNFAASRVEPRKPMTVVGFMPALIKFYHERYKRIDISQIYDVLLRGLGLKKRIYFSALYEIRSDRLEIGTPRALSKPSGKSNTRRDAGNGRPEWAGRPKPDEVS